MDVGEVPNFEALRKWIEKLESWATAASIHYDKAEANLEDKLEAQALDFQKQLDAANAKAERVEYLDGLLALLEDMDRGVKDEGDLDEYLGTIPESDAPTG